MRALKLASLGHEIRAVNTYKPSPQALFFDVFGTLVDWRTSVAREAKPEADKSGGYRLSAHVQRYYQTTKV